MMDTNKKFKGAVTMTFYVRKSTYPDYLRCKGLIHQRIHKYFDDLIKFYSPSSFKSPKGFDEKPQVSASTSSPGELPLTNFKENEGEQEHD